MKIESSTPQIRLKKSVKRCRVWFWVFLVVGLSGVMSSDPRGLFFWACAAWLFLRKKKALDVIRQQDESVAAQQLAEAEAKRLEEEARQAAHKAAWDAFLAENEFVRTIHTKVVGVTFRNSDGSSRQENLSYCISGTDIDLEPFSYKGAPAYAVYCGGLQIGNLDAVLARDLDELPDDYSFIGELKEVTGGDGLKYGCNIMIHLYRKK